MTQVILQPAGGAGAREHYENTIRRPVRLSAIKGLLANPKDIELLGLLYPDGLVPTWGVTAGGRDINRNKWERLGAGDIVLFTGDQRIFASAVVTHKVHSEALAETLWGRGKEGQTWEYVYFIDDVRSQNIPNSVLNYASDGIVRRFDILDREKSKTVLDALALGHAPEILQPDRITELREFSDTTQELDSTQELDERRQALVRKEQSFLRRFLFKGATQAACGICGRLFPIDLLVAAHIKRRSECSHEEKLDYRHNVIPMCKFGCDDLFERGYVTVEDGVVRTLPRALASDTVREYVSQLDGRACPYWNAQSVVYFKWQRDHARK